MPWNQSSLKEQRWGFVRLVLRAKLSIADLCRRIQISRKTAYKWITRFEEDGRRGLGDLCRRAHRVHNRPSPLWRQRIRQSRKLNPTWGARKLRWYLQRKHGSRSVPSSAAIGRWLKRWHQSHTRRARTYKGPVIARPALSLAQSPNQVWTVDYKGWFRTGDGVRVEPLTVRDLASRYIVAICLLPDQTMASTRKAMMQVFRQRGLPQVIRTDNGSPFGAAGALGLTRLSAWWVRLGIKVEFISPGRPDQNGAHEQMHRVFKSEVLRPPSATLRSQTRRTNQWRRQYNHERPHEGLGMKAPAQVYARSKTALPGRLPPWTYRSGWLSRKVRSNGIISLAGLSRFVGEAFERERVGLRRVRGGKWRVYFGPYLVGELYDGEAGIRALVYRKESKRRHGGTGRPLRGSAAARSARLRSTTKRTRAINV
jgi:transposase InsO family protein